MSKNAVIYARYSSDKQREESIEGQIRECLEYAKRQGLSVISTYIDRAMSARTDHRPEFLRMVRDSAKKSFQYVIVYQLDRFSRSRYDSATYKARLKKNGVKVLSAKENISDDPAGILMESVLEGMAEYYSAELAQKVLRGMTENILNGKMPGGTIPLGYFLDANKYLQIHPVESKIVKFVFEQYNKGHSLANIIRELTAQGYRTRKGKNFTTQSFNNFFHNTVYIGKKKWKDLEFDVPAIIDKKLFYEVQELRKMKRQRQNKKSEVYALTGLLKCECGSPMTGTCGTSKNGSRHYYYTCTGKCGAKNIKRDEIEKLVIDTTKEILSDDAALHAIAKQCVIVNEKAIQENETLAVLKNNVEDIARRLKNCEKAIENGLVSETIANRIKELEKELTAANTAYEREKILTAPVDVTEELVYFYLNNIKSERAIIDSFIREVIIHKDKIEIRYNYKKELPTLQNPVTVESSRMEILVDHQGLEPQTP